MNEQPAVPLALTRAVVHDCWNRIGVHGDSSCGELREHVHCRNCPVYSAGAAGLLDGSPPGDYLQERTAHFARPTAIDATETRSVVIFRVGSEWLALPTTVVVEVANLLPIHSLPHRQNGIVLGLGSVRGELLICVSLREVLGVAAAAEQRTDGATAHRRVLVIRREDVRAVCPVDEVHGIHRFHSKDLKEVPTTVARAAVNYSTALLAWRQHAVAMLDAELLFYTIKRSLG
jgi:chemotaxis-related protein WspD